MNILYLCDEYPPGQHGGIGTYVQLIARQLTGSGHKVVVAGLYSPGYGGDDAFNDEGVTIYRFRRWLDARWLKDPQSLIFRTVNYLLKCTGLMDLDTKRSLKLYKRALEKIIIDHKIDLIEMPDYHDYIRFCRSYIPFPRLPVPVVVKLNGSFTYFTREARKYVPPHIVRMDQAILNQATAVTSASNYTADKSAAYLSYPGKIEVIYNGIKINIPVPHTGKDPNQVIFTGTLTAKKGIYQLAKAWNIVNETMPQARLIVLGKGDQQKVISCLTDEARKTVSFLGHVTAEKLYGYLSGSSVSIFPSYSEAFALAPLEAMSCGTAVINSKFSSGPELIDDHINGLLIDPDDTEQIAASVLYLLNNPGICADLAKSGNAKVRQCFDIDTVAAQTLKFYNRVLNNEVLN